MRREEKQEAFLRVQYIKDAKNLEIVRLPRDRQKSILQVIFHLYDDHLINLNSLFGYFK